MKKETFSQACTRLMNYNLRCLGGDLLIIKPNNDCLTICRNHISEPCVDREEGEWTNEEKEAAKHIYLTTEAALR